MKCLKYEDECSVSSLKKGFHEDPEMKQQIECKYIFIQFRNLKNIQYSSVCP